MNQDWRTRLDAAVKKKKMSMRSASLASGMGPGYLHSVIKDGKDPGIDSLLKVCDTVGVTLSYLLYGFDIDPATEALLQTIQGAAPESREAMLTLLKKTANP